MVGCRSASRRIKSILCWSEGCHKVKLHALHYLLKFFLGGIFLEEKVFYVRWYSYKRAQSCDLNELKNDCGPIGKLFLAFKYEPPDSWGRVMPVKRGISFDEQLEGVPFCKTWFPTHRSWKSNNAWIFWHLYIYFYMAETELLFSVQQYLVRIVLTWEIW